MLKLLELEKEEKRLKYFVEWYSACKKNKRQK